MLTVHRWKPWLWALALLAVQCVDRIAGTSTTVGNSIGGIALLADGTPAAGAAVSARSSEIVFTDSQPQGRLLAATIADAQGRFSLPLRSTSEFYLEARGCSLEACKSAAYPEVFFRHYADTVARDSALGVLHMLPSGILNGKLADSAWHPELIRWVGVQGTDHFVKIGSGAGFDSTAFALKDLYPGQTRLSLISIMVGSDPTTGHHVDSRDTTAQVQSGAVTDAGAISFP